MDSAAATKRDIVNIRKDIDELLGILRDFMQTVDNRFTALDFRIDRRFDELESRLDRVEISQDRVVTTMDGLAGRIDTYESESAARDVQFGRLINWSIKAGQIIKLPLKDY